MSEINYKFLVRLEGSSRDAVNDALTSIIKKSEILLSEKVMLRFYPISKKMKSFLHADSSSVNFRSGVLSLDALSIIIDNFMNSNIADLSFYSHTGMLEINLIKQYKNSISLIITGAAGILNQLFLNEISNTVGKIYISNVVFPDEVEAVVFSESSYGSLLEERYFSAAVYNNYFLKTKYQSLDFSFLQDSSLKEDRENFLENIRGFNQSYILYDSQQKVLETDELVLTRNSYYDNEIIFSIKCFGNEITDIDVLKKFLVMAQEEKISNLRYISPKNNEVSVFDYQGYSIFYLSKSL